MAKDKKTSTDASPGEGSPAPEVVAPAAAPEPEAVENAPELDAESLIAKTVQATMETVLKNLLPAAMAAGIKAASMQSPRHDAEQQRILNEALKPPNPENYAAGMNCPVCRQPTGPKGGQFACKGKHRKAVVAPRDEDFWEWFQAPVINGVHYNSGLNRTPIDVPADCDVEGMVQAWELREKSYLRRRTFSGNSNRGGAIDYSRQQRN